MATISITLNISQDVAGYEALKEAVNRVGLIGGDNAPEVTIPALTGKLTMINMSRGLHESVSPDGQSFQYAVASEHAEITID